MFRLLVLGTIVILVGGMAGYGGSYLYDKSYLSSALTNISRDDLTPSPEIAVAGLPATISPVKTEVQVSAEVAGVSTNSAVPAASVSGTGLLLSVTPTISKSDINKLIERFAKEYKVDATILRHLAECESGYNPLHVDKNKAGLYQLSPSIWKSNRTEMGADPDLHLRFNPEEAVKTAAYILSKGKRWVWPVC